MQIAIRSPDTDVEVLAVYHQANIPGSLFLETGTLHKHKVVDVKQICSALGQEVITALPGLHALTGCDTVSSFAGKGKKVALDLVKQDATLACPIQELGLTVPLPVESITPLETFVCKLYKSAAENINEAH